MQHEQTYLCPDEVEAFTTTVTQLRREEIHRARAGRTHPFAVDAWDVIDSTPGPVVKRWAEEALTFEYSGPELGISTGPVNTEPTDQDASDYYRE